MTVRDLKLTSGGDLELLGGGGLVSDEEAIAQMVAAYREHLAKSADGRRVADITVDPVLAESIASVLQ